MVEMVHLTQVVVAVLAVDILLLAEQVAQAL
jgi:hypothetical protein